MNTLNTSSNITSSQNIPVYAEADVIVVGGGIAGIAAAIAAARQGKKVILLDDMIDTAGTITNAANALIERGAIEVDACCTHGVLSGPAIERIEKSAIKELLVLDTIELPEEKKIDKITMVSVADIFANAINCIHNGVSISQLFD